ncbi:methyltransferase family protein [Bacteroidota bacterium]
MQVSLIIKSIIFTILIPGVGIILIPYLIISGTSGIIYPNLSIINVILLLVGISAFIVLLSCIWNFAVYGKGTLAPVAPPKNLVACGIYRHTRNPMYLAVLTILLSESILFWSIYMLLYFFTAVVVFHLFVILYEEPKLEEEFGESYLRYSKSVPRWMIKIKPYVNE